MPFLTFTSDDASGDPSQFTVQLQPPLTLDTSLPWRICLDQLHMFNSVPIVSAERGNNEIMYSPNGGADWKTVTLANGAYSLEAINSALHAAMQANSDPMANGIVDGRTLWSLNISTNKATGKCALYIPAGGVTADNPASVFPPYLFRPFKLYSILGAPDASTVYGDATGAVSTNIDMPGVPNLTDGMLSIYIHSDLVTRTNGGLPAGQSKYNDVIASFALPVGSPARFEYAPAVSRWVSIKKGQDSISSISISIKDNLDRLVNTGQPVTTQLRYELDESAMAAETLNILRKSANK